MLPNQQMDGANIVGSEQAGSSDDGQVVAASRGTTRKEMEVMIASTVQKDIVPVMEKLIRKVVKEEIQSALQKFIQCGDRNDAHEINISAERRSFQLKFLDEVSLPVLTGKEIKGKGGTAMRLAVVETTTEQPVTSGPEASAKVEILVLRTNNDDNENNWSVEDFNNRIIRESDKKKPHFAKSMYVYLKEGVGYLCNVKFGHDSSWMKSCECRLGARIVGNVSGCAVKEGWTESFVVQDSRSKLYKKHHPPSLIDEVWRLEKIGKDGAFHGRLSKEKVNSVQDFLILLFSDPTRLRNILGPGMSAKMWEVTVEHAQTCVFDKKSYSYEASGSLQKNGVVFNMAGQLMGTFSNGQFVPTDKLSESEKAEARELVISAFRDREKIVPFDDESSQTMPASSRLSVVQSSNFPSEGSDHQDSNSHKISKYPSSQSHDASTDFIQSLYSIEDANIFDDYLHAVDAVDIRYDQPFSYPAQVTDSLICDTDSMTQTFCTNEHLQYFETDCSNLESSPDLQSAIHALMPCSTIPIGKAKWHWNVLVSVLRWWFSMKKIIMAKRTRDKDISRCC